MIGKEWELGRRGEREFVDFCRSQPDWFVIPTGLIGDRWGGPGAPMAEGQFEKVILPDLLVSMRGKCKWYDVKTKSQTPPNETRGVLVTGCAFRNWKHYLRIQEETGIPGALAFIQCDRGELWLGDLDVIAIGHHTCMNLDKVEYGTIYFRASQFDRYRLCAESIQRLREATISAKNDRYLKNHEDAVNRVISEWKQAPLRFGRMEPAR